MLLFFQYDYLLSLIIVLLRCRTCHHGDDDDADDDDASNGGGRLSSAILETHIYTPRDTTCGFQPWFHLPWGILRPCLPLANSAIALSLAACWARHVPKIEAVQFLYGFPWVPPCFTSIQMLKDAQGNKEWVKCWLLSIVKVKSLLMLEESGNMRAKCHGTLSLTVHFPWSTCYAEAKFYRPGMTSQNHGKTLKMLTKLQNRSAYWKHPRTQSRWEGPPEGWNGGKNQTHQTQDQNRSDMLRELQTVTLETWTKHDKTLQNDRCRSIRNSCFCMFLPPSVQSHSACLGWTLKVPQWLTTCDDPLQKMRN